MLTSKQLKTFEDDGFLVVRGLFDQYEIRRISSALDALQKRASDYRYTFDEGDTRFVKHGDNIQRIVWCPGLKPELLKVGQKKELTSLVKKLINDDQLEQIICQAHYKLPGDGVSFPWHQDSEHRNYNTDYWQDRVGNGSFIQTVTAIDKVTKENGPISFFAGSHLLGHLTAAQKAKFLEDQSSYEKLVTPTLEPGDSVIFGPFVLHGSLENLSSKPRRVFINGFCLPNVNFYRYPGSGLGVPVQ